MAEEKKPVEKKTETPVEKKPVKRTGVVSNCSLLNARAAAKTDAAVVTLLSKGAEVTIKGNAGEFYKIESDQGDLYVMKDYITIK